MKLQEFEAMKKVSFSLENDLVTALGKDNMISFKLISCICVTL